jgi:hypothetical protein
MTKTLKSVRLRLLLIPVAAVALTVGCGENGLESATGPSDISDAATLRIADAADSVATASTDGEFITLAKGGGKDKGNDPDDPTTEDDLSRGPGRGSKPDHGGGPGRSHEDRVVGFVSAKVGDSLTVRDITVIAAPTAVIRHGHRRLTMDDIQVGDHLQARGAMEDTALVAIEIKVQDTGHDNVVDPDEAELNGAIADLNLGTTPCPSVSFKIGATTVTTDGSTTFDDAACGDLANGKVVEVEGTRQADGSILAKKVEFEAGPDEVEGFVFEFSGAAGCPAVTFKVGPVLSLATKVTTTSSTTFTGVTCAMIANGARVEVEGTKQADGSITAASVEPK